MLFTQFHGVEDESMTLHQAAGTSMLTPFVSTELFLEICSAPKYVHLTGYFHNDVKANHAVLEKSLPASDKYIPVLLHFVKAVRQEWVQSYWYHLGKNGA